MYGSHSVKKRIGMDWSVTRHFAVTCRYSTDFQALAFINLSNQPFDAEKVPFGRILSARA